MKPISYGRQSITDEDIQSVVDTLKSDYLTQGPKVAEFEREFARAIGAEYAVAVSNGTAALHLCAMALGVDSQTNVIVTPLTFAASANCIKYCGGNVHFCDIDSENYLMDLNKLRKMLEDAPMGFYKGVIPVDFAGYPIHCQELRKIADEYGLWIIEDACHAPGAYFVDSDGKKQFSGNGVFADLTCFSFHPVKHIATGEGGMITTNNHELFKKVSLYRTHGITKDVELMSQNPGGWYYEMQELGYNYRLSDIQAALGLSQLMKLDQSLIRRNEIAARYNSAFAGIDAIKTPKVADGIYHAYHLYVIQVEDRLGLYNYLRENKIYAQVHYIPVHLLPYYKSLGSIEGDCPVVENYYQHCLSLPMFPTLTDEEQQYVIEKVLEFVK